MTKIKIALFAFLSSSLCICLSNVRANLRRHSGPSCVRISQQSAEERGITREVHSVIHSLTESHMRRLITHSCLHAMNLQSPWLSTNWKLGKQSQSKSWQLKFLNPRIIDNNTLSSILSSTYRFLVLHLLAAGLLTFFFVIRSVLYPRAATASGLLLCREWHRRVSRQRVGLLVPRGIPAGGQREDLLQCQEGQTTVEQLPACL